MATSRKLGLTRDQLASFLDDFEKIKQFENLFSGDGVFDSNSAQCSVASIHGSFSQLVGIHFA